MLSLRDQEVLRTLLRVQVASTASLLRAFYPSARVAQRRLRTLRTQGLVAPHRKGLPEGMQGTTFWRLTPRGLERVVADFPHEPVPPDAVERAAQASLRFVEHRTALVELYLGVIASPRGDRDLDPDLAGTRARADALTWRGECHVCLPYDLIEGATKIPRQLIPDAMVTTAHARVFVELDRSTETTERCRRAVERYAAHLAQGHYRARFADELPAQVLYVTRTPERQRSLAAAFSPVALGSLSLVALPFFDALAYLHAVVGAASGPDAAASAGSDRPAAAASDRPAAAGSDPPAAAGWRRVTPPPRHSTPRAPRAPAVELLGQVYEAYRAELERQQQAGATVTPAPCLHAAYEYLRSRDAGRLPPAS